MKRIFLVAAFVAAIASPAFAQNGPTYDNGYCDGYRKAVQEFHANWQRWDTLVNIMNKDELHTALVTALRNSVKHFIHKGDLPDREPYAFRNSTGVVICDGKP